MSASNLLVELRVEELPPKALWRLGQAFAKSVHEGLVQQRLVASHAAAGATAEQAATQRGLGLLFRHRLPVATDARGAGLPP